MTLLDAVKAAAVEIIWVLWSFGILNDNDILIRIHANWFPDWVTFKTYYTMKSVDKQIRDIWEPSELDKPIFKEEEEGETDLGGMMELKSPWSEDVPD